MLLILITVRMSFLFTAGLVYSTLLLTYSDSDKERSFPCNILYVKA